MKEERSVPLVLGALGISPETAALYEALLDHPASTRVELSGIVAVSAPRARRLLGELERLGLITRMAGLPTRFMPAPPELALGALASRRRHELDELRFLGQRLADQLRVRLTPRQSTDLIELVVGGDASRQHVSQLQAGAQEELLLTDRPPYVAGRLELNDDELALLRRGVSVRCIYHQPGLALPGHMDQVLQYVAAGEQARLHPDVVIKMMIVDRRVAMVPMSLLADPVASCVLVHESPLLEALAICFESMWAKALTLSSRSSMPPRTGPDSDQPTAEESQVLQLLAAGMTDAAAAENLGMSERTVVRHMRTLAKKVGASSRFQVGLEVGRRGWL